MVGHLVWPPLVDASLVGGLLAATTVLVVGFAIGWAIGWRRGFREGRSTIPLATIRSLASHLSVCEGAGAAQVSERLCADLDLEPDEARRVVEAVLPEAPGRTSVLRRIG